MSARAVIVLAAGFVVFSLYVGYALVRVNRTNERVDRIEQQLCAFRFEEDGSASPRDDDGDRLACMYQHGYRAR